MLTEHQVERWIPDVQHHLSRFNELSQSSLYEIVGSYDRSAANFSQYVRRQTGQHGTDDVLPGVLIILFVLNVLCPTLLNIVWGCATFGVLYGGILYMAAYFGRAGLRLAVKTYRALIKPDSRILTKVICFSAITAVAIIVTAVCLRIWFLPFLIYAVYWLSLKAYASVLFVFTGP